MQSAGIDDASFYDDVEAHKLMWKESFFNFHILINNPVE